MELFSKVEQALRLKNRTRIGFLTGANGELATDTDYTFTLALDLAAGAWSTNR